MIEIKPGPELDRAVAEAIGFRGAIRTSQNVLAIRPMYEFVRYMDEKTSKPWSPSTDLNAAFEAAEKVELFGNARGMTQLNSGLWMIYGFGDAVMIKATTPALAICAAILKLKENDHEAT